MIHFFDSPFLMCHSKLWCNNDFQFHLLLCKCCQPIFYKSNLRMRRLPTASYSHLMLQPFLHTFFLSLLQILKFCLPLLHLVCQGLHLLVQLSHRFNLAFMHMNFFLPFHPIPVIFLLSIWYEQKFRIKNVPVNDLPKTWLQLLVMWLLAVATETLNAKYHWMLLKLLGEKHFNERQVK